jgi:hypothetical protein
VTRPFFHTKLKQFVEVNTPATITDVIENGMPTFLHGQLNIRFADLNEVANRTLAKIDKELTPQKHHQDIYLCWARPKATEQTHLVGAEPNILRQSRLSFAVPARIIQGRRRSMSPRGRRARCFLYAGKSGKGRGILESDSMHQFASTNQYWYRVVKKHDLDLITFTAWRAPPGAAPVLYSLIETIYMVAFGTLCEKELLPTAIRDSFHGCQELGHVQSRLELPASKRRHIHQRSL